MFYTLIFAALAVVLIVGFSAKWSRRNSWPDDE